MLNLVRVLNKLTQNVKLSKGLSYLGRFAVSAEINRKQSVTYIAVPCFSQKNITKRQEIVIWRKTQLSCVHFSRWR